MNDLNDVITDEEEVNLEQEDQIKDISSDEQTEILKSIELPTESSDNKEDVEKEVKENNEEFKHHIVDPSELTTIVQDDDIDEEAVDLYNEFNSFMKIKTDIDLASGVKIVIPTGIDLIDAILGGGFAVGCLNIVVGQPGGGKSVLVSQALANGQKIYNGKLLCGYLDSEESMTVKRLYNLGIRNPKTKPHTDVTVEKVFKFIEGMALFKDEKKIKDIPSIIVWDSIANTLSEKEREATDINSVIGYKAKLLSFLVPKYVAKCSEYNICLLAVNQLRDKLNMSMFAPAPDLKFMSSGKDMPGGQSLKFNAFQMVNVNVKTAIDTTKADCKYPFDGFISKIKCIKNKLFTPNIEIEAVADFHTGFSNFWTNYNFLTKCKKLKTGSWNYLIDDPKQRKFRTKDAETVYTSEPDFKELFDNCVKETIKIEIINKGLVE